MVGYYTYTDTLTDRRESLLCEGCVPTADGCVFRCKEPSGCRGIAGGREV